MVYMILPYMMLVYIDGEATEVPVHPAYLDDAYEGELLVLFVDLLGAPGRVSVLHALNLYIICILCFSKEV